MSVDTVLLSHNDPSSALRTTADSVGGGGTEWGAWYELTNKDDKLTTSSIPFLCDSFVNLPSLLPASEPGSTGTKRGSAFSQLSRLYVDVTFLTVGSLPSP